MSKRRDLRRWHIGDRVCWHQDWFHRGVWHRSYGHGVVDGLRGDLALIAGQMVPAYPLQPIQHRAGWRRQWGHEQHRRTVGG